MQKRIDEIKEQLSSINEEAFKLAERQEQLEAMSVELSGELGGYLQLDIDLVNHAKRIQEAKKEKESEETCGRDQAESLTQENDND